MARCAWAMSALLLGITAQGFAAEKPVDALLARIETLDIDFTRWSAPREMPLNEVLLRVKLLIEGSNTSADVRRELGRGKINFKDGEQQWTYGHPICGPTLTLLFENDFYVGCRYWPGCWSTPF